MTHEVDLLVCGQPGLQIEFQNSQSYTEKPCLNEKNKKPDGGAQPLWSSHPLKAWVWAQMRESQKNLTSDGRWWRTPLILAEAGGSL